MRRRTYQFEIIEILLCIVIIACTIVLFFKANTLTVLYPIVFGAASLVSLLYAFEGKLYNKNKPVRRSRTVVFLILAALLAGAVYVSIRVIT